MLKISQVKTEQKKGVFLNHPVVDVVSHSELTGLGQVTLYNKGRFSIKDFFNMTK